MDRDKDREHYQDCDDQPEGFPCICEQIHEEYLVDEEANNGEHEFEWR